MALAYEWEIFIVLNLRVVSNEMKKVEDTATKQSTLFVVVYWSSIFFTRGKSLKIFPFEIGTERALSPLFT